MVWNKTPECVLDGIWHDLLKDYTVTFQKIADTHNVSEWLVSSLWRSRATKEQKAERYSLINKQAKLGIKNPQFGKTKLSNHKAKEKILVAGYLTIWEPDWWDGLNPKGNRAYEHQVVWCEHNGYTKVPKGYVVHHKDHNRLNNSIDNLELMTRSAHMKYHATERATTRRNAVGNSVPEVQSFLNEEGDIV